MRFSYCSKTVFILQQLYCTYCYNYYWQDCTLGGVHIIPSLIFQRTSWPWMTLVKYWRSFMMCVKSGTSLGCSSNWGLRHWIQSKHSSLTPHVYFWRCSRLGWPTVTIPAGRLLQMLSGDEVWDNVGWLITWRQSTKWRRLKCMRVSTSSNSQ